MTGRANRMPAIGRSDIRDLLQEAAEWFAVMQSQAITARERKDWQDWLSSSEQHRQAWQRVENINQQFNDLPVAASRAALNSSAKSGMSRRQALKACAFLFIAVVSIWQVAHQQHWNAEYRTSRGEIRQFSLADGSQLWLNTASAVDVEYSSTQRRIVLRSGEVYIETAPDMASTKRPLVVESKRGRLRALGTRFGVRENKDRTLLSVMEGAVEVKTRIKPEDQPQTRRIEAGQQVYFGENIIQPTSPLISSSFWIKGTILADNMRLDDFIEALNRYYSGHLSVASDVADLRLVGAYPVNDIERILSALEKSLPVTVHHTLPWWVRIQAAEG